MEDAERRYRDVLERAREDQNVLGVILSGSRAVDAFVTPHSDFDCYLILREPDDGRWQYQRGSGVETVTATAGEFARHATVGSTTFWNRSSFLYARVEFDTPDGEVARLLDAKRRLSADEADRLVRESLDDYINCLYRSLKNLRDGRLLAGRLDALESLPRLLMCAFARAASDRSTSGWRTTSSANRS